jgi:PAS domain S-box-containing protein
MSASRQIHPNKFTSAVYCSFVDVGQLLPSTVVYHVTVKTHYHPWGGGNMDRLLNQAVNDAPDAILISNREGVIRFWNSGAEQMFGHTSAEAVGQSLDLIIPENLRGRHWESYRRVMASGEMKYKTGLLSSPGVHKDGSRISLEFSMVLLHDEAGEMQGCASIMRDVTERWKKEKALKERLSACETSLAARPA